MDKQRPTVDGTNTATGWYRTSDSGGVCSWCQKTATLELQDGYTKCFLRERNGDREATLQAELNSTGLMQIMSSYAAPLTKGV